MQLNVLRVGNVTKSVNSARNLGVIFDKHLHMVALVITIYRTGFYDIFG